MYIWCAIFLAAPHLQLASPPGRGKIRAAPSPTPPSHAHSTRHQSTSDEDNNAFDDKEEVSRVILRTIYNLSSCVWRGDDFILCVIWFLDILLSRSQHIHSGVQSPLSGIAIPGSRLWDGELRFLDVTAGAVAAEFDAVQNRRLPEDRGF